jgi:hypothetical protein
MEKVEKQKLEKENTYLVFIFVCDAVLPCCSLIGRKTVQHRGITVQQ